MTSQTLTRPESAPAPAEPAEPRVYRCECGHELRFSGSGRHRVYFDFDETTLGNAVINRVCPACERGLPGKNRP